jgi:hypothetical protein
MPGACRETDFRHADLASTGPYDMNAAFMRLGRHERGTHVVGRVTRVTASGPEQRVAWILLHRPARRCAMSCLEIMTSDTAKPETEPQARPETFRSHLPAIVAATTGTVLAATLGSLIGAAGTIVGIVIGSLASGTASWWAERGIRRSAALATARAEAIRARGHPLHPGEHAAATQAAAITRDTTAAGGGHDRPRLRWRWRWAGPAAFIIAAFIGGALVVTLVEGAAGKPLSAVVQGKPGNGFTVAGGTVGKPAPASPSPTPSASATGATATAPASSTTPSGASSSPAASTAPAATSPSSATPASSAPNSATPSATPTATG